MTASIWHAFGRQLRRPEGIAGALTGRLMERVNREAYRLALAALDVRATDHALELGFGPGRGLEALERTGARVAGLDHSPAMLRRAARLNRRPVREGRMDLRLGSFARLPWEDAVFDRALLVNVAYFLDPEGAELAELRRVLRPRARAALYVTDRETMSRWPFACPETHRTLSAGSLSALCRAGGFGRVEVRRAKVAAGVEGLVALVERDR